MTIDQYLATVNQRYKQGNATEHTFRGDLQQLLETLVPEIRATNEPKRQACGAPDYIIEKKNIPVGFIEAKDIGNQDLQGTKKSGNKEQFDRYKASLTNIIFTDYISFYLYQDGEFKTSVAIGEIENGQIKPLPENFRAFANVIEEFCVHIGQTIKSSKKLAEMMAGKARLLADVLRNALESDEETQANTTLKQQMHAFKEILIHDITPKAFADVYAQTVAYGMFAARLHDPTMENFTRQEAAELIPKSNPFLRKLFGYIAGPDIDDRIKWIVENLAEVFLACNVREILKNYGKATKMEDPIIHFYETFLSEYDPKLRKSRGVWYTPQPVVNFIVRAVDDILKTDFDLPAGLADTSKTTVKLNTQVPDKRSPTGYKQYDQEVHKVQILDPATGTGTFLAETVKQIHKRFEGQQGIWSNYVEQHLIPRLNGFELLMASYAMAHLKLDLLLTETGYQPTTNQRLRVYLTNSLEESHPDTGTLFSNWLSTEANEANHIKRDTPVMCVIGNPPYAVSSTNKNEWIENLISDYKKDLKERSYNSLSDDYVKFIRYGQYFVEKNGSGILAYISNNSFLDGIVFRQMRKNLLENFDKIYILDLHGSSKKNEVSPDGSPDQNVFDIMQGVSINIFVKTGKKRKNEFGKLLTYDLYGKRDIKYDFLNNINLKSLQWNAIENVEPNYFFVLKDFESLKKYNEGFKVNDLLTTNNVGFTSARDSSLIHIDMGGVKDLLNDLENGNIEKINSKHKFGSDSRDWTLKGAIEDINSKEDKNITQINYRPFDHRYTHYSKKVKGFFSYPRWEVMQHFYKKENIGLIATRLNRQKSLGYFWISNLMIERHILDSAGDSTSFFPLYLYPENNNQKTIEKTQERTPNLNTEILKQIEEKVGLEFVPEKENRTGTFAPIDLLDFIYAVLHSPTYREKYKEFLKIDFPRVPYPTDPVAFWQLVALGSQLREIHLLGSPVVEQYITAYPEGGDNIITRKLTKNSPGFQPDDNNPATGRVWINDNQYFDKVPLVAWEFYIGGYQPAQKWLKDRVGRELNFEDILHYQKIIVALTETVRLMGEIDRLVIN